MGCVACCSGLRFSKSSSISLHRQSFVFIHLYTYTQVMRAYTPLEATFPPHSLLAVSCFVYRLPRNFFRSRFLVYRSSASFSLFRSRTSDCSRSTPYRFDLCCHSLLHSTPPSRLPSSYSLSHSLSCSFLVYSPQCIITVPSICS